MAPPCQVLLPFSGIKILQWSVGGISLWYSRSYKHPLHHTAFMVTATRHLSRFLIPLAYRLDALYYTCLASWQYLCASRLPAERRCPSLSSPHGMIRVGTARCLVPFDGTAHCHILTSYKSSRLQDSHATNTLSMVRGYSYTMTTTKTETQGSTWNLASLLNKHRQWRWPACHTWAVEHGAHACQLQNTHHQIQRYPGAVVV